MAMHGLVRCGFVAAALAACHGTDMTAPDGGAQDAAPSTGLFIRWSSKEPIPGDLGGDLVVTSATLRFATLELISDQGVGDPSTTAFMFSEAWGDGAMLTELTLPQAPPGLYSKVAFQIDGFVVENSIDIYGSLRNSGNPKPFEIHDLALVDVSLDCAVTLQPGGTSHIGLEADFANALGVIDFSMVPDVGGTLVLQTTDSQMEVFRDKLRDSFRVFGDQQAHASATRSSNAE